MHGVLWVGKKMRFLLEGLRDGDEKWQGGDAQEKI
jgi:hypothetical protein